MTDQATAAARPDGDKRHCPRRQTYADYAWRLVLGALGLAFVCVVLALAGTFIP